MILYKPRVTVCLLPNTDRLYQVEDFRIWCNVLNRIKTIVRQDTNENKSEILWVHIYIISLTGVH
jgi:hypothetical protein